MTDEWVGVLTKEGLMTGDGREISSTSLIWLVTHAPLAAIQLGGQARPVVVHAVTAEALCADLDSDILVAACGAGNVKLLPVGPDGKITADRGDGGLLAPVEWPLAVAGLAPTLRRCRECHRATGSKRPRARLESR